MMGAQDRNFSDGPVPGGASRPVGRIANAPVAGLLFDSVSRPSLADLAHNDRGFRVLHGSVGEAELFCDGLAFDCRGLAPAAPLRIDTPLQHLALMRIDLLQRALRVRLLDPARWRGKVLNTRDPALDYNHLDRMAETLWQGTETVIA